MKPGRPKTPTSVLKSRGSWRAETRKAEPATVPGEPDCPKWLRGESRQQWTHMVADLDQRRLLSKSYRESLTLFCEAWGEFVELKETLRSMNATDPAAMTLMRLKNAAAERVNRMGQQFGYSPSAKAGTTVEQQPPENGKLRFFQ